MDLFENLYPTRITEILPNTKRTQELRAKKQADEDYKKKEKEKAMKQQQEQEWQIKQLLKERERLLKEEEEKKRLQIKKQEEEKNEINALKGKFGNMISQLQTETTPLEMTVTGLYLLPAQIRILVQASLNNSSLRTLALCRKDITDEEGYEIGKIYRNSCNLNSLDFEGNKLGVKTATIFGEFLGETDQLLNVNLEGNNLTQYSKDRDGKINIDRSGFEAICNSLKVNKSLLSLNLHNTNLDRKCGELLRDAIMQNDTLISLDITGNLEMSIHDVRDIQDKISNNKAEYDNERYMEFLERKRMKREEEIASILVLKEETKVKIEEGIKSRIEYKREKFDDDWRKKMEEEQNKFEKDLQKLEKATKQRLSKRPKGKKKKKK